MIQIKREQIKQTINLGRSTKKFLVKLEELMKKIEYLNYVE